MILDLYGLAWTLNLAPTTIFQTTHSFKNREGVTYVMIEL
jgi:hypothetical protein